MEAIFNLSGNLFEQTEAMHTSKLGFSSTIDADCLTLSQACYSLDTVCTPGCHP